MTDFAELISRETFFVVGRLDPEWRIADRRSKGLFLYHPPTYELLRWFFGAVSMMFQSMADTMEVMKAGGGFPGPVRIPAIGWAVFLSNHAIAVHDHRFLLADTTKVGALDDLVQVLSE